ncbi:MAG: flagellar basal body rod protein FlgB [Selenomonadaceae bacterium]|nr:flagellar basal body rod protein FlgB [Selenomonadaceae bacterium]
MLEQILNSPNFNYLARGMTAATMRQEVISHNIANVNTPNYRKTAVEFEELLAKEIYGEDTGNKLQMVRTNDAHLPAVNKPVHAVPTMVEDNTTIMREDNNNVDIDIEMATLLKNQMYYNALATQLRGHVNKVRTAITSGQS